jgi:hypothetical protein
MNSIKIQKAGVTAAVAVMLVNMASLSFAGTEPVLNEKLIGSMKYRHREFKIVTAASPKGCRIAWVYWPIDEGGHLVLDGSELEPWEKLLKPLPIFFSEDGEHFAYAGVRANKYYLVVDGKKSAATYDHIVKGSPLFSADGKHIVWVAGIGNNQHVIVHDGKEVAKYLTYGECDETPGPPKGADKQAVDAARDALPLYDDGYGVSLSPNGKRLAFIVRKGGNYVIVVDGKEGKLYDQMSPNPVLFSQDSAHWCHNTVKDGKRLFILDGQEFGPYDDGLSHCCAFSPDSKRWGVGMVRGGKHVLLLDGREAGSYDAILEGSLVFSPDGKRVAYGVENNKKDSLLVDGLPALTTFDGYSLTSMKFSPDSRHFACAASRGDKWFAVVDGRESKEYDDISANTPVFSPDSNHVAFAAKKGKKWLVVIDDRPGPEYDDIYNPVYSPDSKHNAFIGKKGAIWAVVLDGRELGTWDGIFARPVFREDGKLEVITRRDTNAYRVTISLGP